MIGEEVRLSRRILMAGAQLVINVILWIVIPSILLSFIRQDIPNIPLAYPNFIYVFGAAITGLQVLRALTEGKAVSVVFASGGNVASAFYIWEAVNGGTLSVTAAGMNVTFVFELLIFLLMLPSLFGAVQAPLVFLLDQSEAARAAPELP
jgi:hypothetical protein